MSKFKTFVVGDRVLHSSRGEGVVIERTAESVTVQFYRTDKRGQWVTGIYPKHWFDWAEDRGTLLRNLMEVA